MLLISPFPHQALQIQNALLYPGGGWEEVAVDKPRMKGRHGPPLPTLIHSNHSLPPSPSKHFPTAQTLSVEISPTVNDQNDDVDCSPSGQSLELLCLLFNLPIHSSAFLLFSDPCTPPQSHLLNFLLDFNAQWKEIFELDRGWVRVTYGCLTFWSQFPPMEGGGCNAHSTVLHLILDGELPTQCLALGRH